MQSETTIDNRSDARGRRRRRGRAAADGPVFVDNSGRRSKLLRRLGLLLGVACLGYAVVLGMAFMGFGTSLTPSQLLPFANGQGGPGPGNQPQGGRGNPVAPPSGSPSAPPSGAPAPSASADTSAN
ncbi:hypothetical protein [Streptomyces lanatus]|uniref:Uncharacterized protein n=1 Tax=Streptomyces lanatus TaxID=66900 RepID=A0ABV1Y1T2_9ACTN|nr:hypothetical protein [Streptomyces lanatus]GHH20097.1 hypothetical protein GCM10018780_66200 [Streptomyces lanatus]